MLKLIFLNEDGYENIFDERDIETMNIVNEKRHLYAIKQLVIELHTLK
jgi:hypothetical protein